MSTLNCHTISKGKTKGKAITSNDHISFLGGVDPNTGIVIDSKHDLKGQSIKDKILVIPGGKGSTVGSYVIFQMFKNRTAPSAIICKKAEPIIATGAIMSGIPMVDQVSNFDLIETDMDLEIDADNGKIRIL